jgi:hypothetical protein
VGCGNFWAANMSSIHWMVKMTFRTVSLEVHISLSLRILTSSLPKGERGLFLWKDDQRQSLWLPVGYPHSVAD